MKQIPLSRGLFAIVDDNDYDNLMQWKWYVSGKYAARNRSIVGGKSRKIILMHRQIMGNPASWIDHKNRNTLDNRRNNLRICTGSQSNMNKSVRKTSAHQIKGVSWNYNKRGSDKKPYRARIFLNGKERHLGFFSTKEAAGEAYCKAAKALFGEFAYDSSEVT